MAFERIELNICPAGDMPVFHCSQYDTGRPIIIDLKNGDDAFTPSAGTTFELHCRKVDDNIVTLDTYEVDGNTLTFNSTEQLCACPGDNLCEVAIYLNESCMGTLNFMLHVEPDPLAGGLESETQIHNLTEQVEEITEQVIGDNYYDKTEVDDLLDTKADAATTYTKTEVDTALNLKADRSTTYTKTETNNLLAGKADASDTYSKAQVDNALALKANSADLATVATTGDYDDLLNKPTIPAAQVQSDYAQSDNTQVDYIKNKPDINGMIADAIYNTFPSKAASGAIASFATALAMKLVSCTAAEGATAVTRCGVNWLPPYTFPDGGGIIITSNNGRYGISGTTTAYYQIIADNSFILKAGTYTLKNNGNVDNNLVVQLRSTDGLTTFASSSINSDTFTLNEDTEVKFRMAFNNVGSYSANISPQLEVGSTASDFTPYNGQTVPVADVTTLVTLSGLNNVFADSGDVTVQYKDTTL